MKNKMEGGGSSSGEGEIMKLMFGFADSMALKCAVELRIPDILHSHSQPITLSQLASSIAHDHDHTIDLPCLARIMRFLAHRNIFTASGPGTTLRYGPTRLSKWLLHDSDTTLAPFLLMQSHPAMQAPWQCLSRCVREGGTAFEKAHGKPVWELGSENAEINKVVNDGMECTSKIVVRAVVEEYGGRGGFEGTVVDVGGGTGTAVAEIVRAYYPRVKGVNFDLPHVVATAPEYDGVSHVGGDMFQAIPAADVVFMKFVMHDWDDENCMKILKNCRRSIPEKTGKIVIVDVVLKPSENGEVDDMGLVFDLLMIAHSSGGQERTEVEWKKLLEDSGFPRYNIINIPTLPSIIEAYPV